MWTRNFLSVLILCLVAQQSLATPCELLIEAAEVNDTSNLLELLRACKRTSEYDDPWTALHAAALHNAIEVAEFLIENGMDVNSRDGNLYTPLTVALTKGHAKMGWILLSYGAEF